jgi:hypothetical protein
LMLESQNSVNDFIAEIFFIFMKKLWFDLWGGFC